MGFRSLTEGIDTSTHLGRFFFHVLAALAQMERDLIVERTQAGLVAARRQGKVGGRPRRMTAEKVAAAKHLLGQERPVKEVARALGVSVATLYRWVPATERTPRQEGDHA